MFRTLKVGLASSALCSVVIGALAWTILRSGLFVLTPPIAGAEILRIAAGWAQAALLFMLLASLVAALGVQVLYSVARLKQPHSGIAPVTAAVSPPIIFITPLVVLFLNVRVLRFRYSTISIVTDILVLLAAGVLLLVSVRIARDRFESRTWLDGPVLAVVAALVLFLRFLIPVGDGSPLEEAAAQSAGKTKQRSASQAPGRDSQDRPQQEDLPPAVNFVVISIDTLRPDHLGSYGYHRDTSPNIDRMAAEGVRFANAYTTSPWTLPSHHSLITGQYPSTHGADTSPVFTSKIDALAPSAVTLAEVLQDNSYSTAAFTSASLVGEAFGFDQGFQVMKTSYSHGLSGRWSEAKEWLETMRAEPFFVFLHCYNVHDYSPPDELRGIFMRPYDGRLAELAENDRRLFGRLITSSGFFGLDEPDIAYLTDLYDATIREVDGLIGEMRSYFEERGLWQRTVFMILSDHGEEFWEHGGTGHGFTLFEEQLRIPAILTGPGLPQGRVVDSRVRMIDFMPTLLDLARVPIPKTVQGGSLIPDVFGRHKHDRPAIAEASHVGNIASLIQGNKKAIRERYLSSDLLTLDGLIYNLRQLASRAPDRTFDLNGDPGERQPVANDKELFEALEKTRLDNLLRGVLGGNTSEEKELDPETLRQLKALGYLN